MSSRAVDLPNLPLLMRLGQSDAQVRKRALTDRQRGETPQPVLALLSWDTHSEVRFAAAAAHSNTDERTCAYARLAANPDSACDQVFRDNPHLIPDHALRTSPLWADTEFRAKVASRGGLVAELQHELAQDASPVVRHAAASNDNLLGSLLSGLSRDHDPLVSGAATDQLNRRERQLKERAATTTNWTYDSNALYASWSLAVRRVLTLDVSTEDDLLGEVARTSVKLGEVGAARVLSQPWVPAHVLLELSAAHRQANHVLDAVASNPNTPTETLEEFAFGAWGNERACLALRNPSIKTEMLTRWAINPQVPRIGELQIEAIWANPSLPKRLLATAPPDLAAKKGIAQNEAAPGFVLAKLAEDTDIHVRCAVSENRATPVTALLLLAGSSVTDLTYGIAARLARNPSAPRQALESLAGHTEFRVRQSVAQSFNTPADLLVKLAADADPSIRLAAARNPATPQPAVDALKNDPEVLSIDEHFISRRTDHIDRLAERLAEEAPLPRPSNPAEAATTLISALGISDRVELAAHSTPYWIAESEFIQRVLARDPSPKVRAHIATFGSEDLRRTLANDESRHWLHDVVSHVAWHTRDPTLAASLVRDERARRSLASNPVTPADALDKIFESVGDSPYLLERLAQHANASSNLLARLVEASEPGSNTRAFAAQHPGTGPDVLTLLARDQAASVRQAVAAHPITPASTLEELANDEDCLVRIIIAMNRKTPVQALERLASDADEQVRQLAALNPNTHADTLERLANDGDSLVKIAISMNRQTRAQTLARLASDADEQVRQVAALNPNTHADVRRHLACSTATSPVLLEILAGDADRDVRLAAAGNRGASAEVLQQLAADTEKPVRLTVARRSDAPPAALQLLAEDRTWAVRRAAKSSLRRHG